jgi:hypothetical protein
MAKAIRMSAQTRWNWLIDAAVFASGLVVFATSIYFLVWPIGRNAQSVLGLGRELWEEWHLWGGVSMILVVAVHFAYHWGWVKSMARRVWLAIRTGKNNFSSGAKLNIAVDLCIAMGFLVTAVTGIYFLFAPAGGYQGGRNPGWDPGFLFSRTLWDNLHTWGGTAMIAGVLVHFYLHWGWTRKVTVNFFRSLRPASKAESRSPQPGI